MRLGSDGFDLFIHHFCPAGAFVVGVIVPREGGISIAFVEKLEDMVQIIFLPIVSNPFEHPSAFLNVPSISRYPDSTPTWG